jgi:phosphatidylserine decarboxylase
VLKKIFPPIHPEGVIFSFIFAIITIILWQFHIFLGIIGTILTAWCLYFFRNPDRVTPTDSNLVISPADGLIQSISQVVPPQELNLGQEKLTRISIFMNVFNVHVNRIPIDGTIRKIHYHKGKFLNASLDKASIHNERQCFMIENKDKIKIGFIQIAGLIARRIRCDIAEGQQLKAGQRFGLIRFGSRVDVFLPKGVNPLVIEGQLAIAGETVLANLKSKESTRHGEVR